MLDNDIVRTAMLFLLIALFLWLLIKFLYDWQKDERVRIRRPVDEAIDNAAAAPEAPALVDDLTKIEGIGPKISELLNEAGIVSFDDLESTESDTLKRLLEKAGKRFKMHDPSTWPEQAALASEGDWDELKKMQESLAGGKK